MVALKKDTNGELEDDFKFLTADTKTPTGLKLVRYTAKCVDAF